jgi:glycine/D-amino acid oxidase-like deaminating enzyme
MKIVFSTRSLPCTLHQCCNQRNARSIQSSDRYYLFLGVKIIETCHIEEILTEKQRAGQYDRVTSAVTSQGNIKCDVFINCTGLVKYAQK